MINHDEKVWRYIDSGALDGATNMATGDAIIIKMISNTAATTAPPTAPIRL